MTKRVFVSSTFADLKDHRESVREIIRRFGAEDIAMENFGSRDDRPKDACLRFVREDSDAFVGIYARRYGFVAAEDQVSISELEYQAASEAGVPRLIYILPDAAEWPEKDVEGEPGKSRLAEFKRKLKAAHIVSPFTSREDLAAKVSADLGRTFADPSRHSVRRNGGLYHQPPAGWMAQATANQWRYKAVAFDLDGTLLRGIDFMFSWEAVWNGLGFAATVQRELRREYRQRASAGEGPQERIDAYREWCEKAVNHFRARRVTRQQFRAFSDPLQLTKNFESTMARLREEGVVTALISGGIHCFLEDKIPDFRRWFDFAFINILKFDDAGLLSGVLATEFDFEGKTEALKLVAERAGCAVEETVFVGDGFNDESILLAAGKGIAYPPKDQAVEGASQVLIDVDDLEKILEHVLVE